MIKKLSQQAFTLLELLIATTVFSVILLLVTAGIIQIGNNYYKGAVQSRTQETARSIIDEISRGIQFSGETIIPTTLVSGGAYPASGGIYAFCVNGVGYAYIMDRQLVKTVTNPADQAAKTLIAYSPGSCAGAGAIQNVTAGATTGRELLAQGMRLTDLNVQPGSAPGTYIIKVGVATGEFDLLNTTAGIHNSCKGGAGQQYCAVSILSTTVQKRIK